MLLVRSRLCIMNDLVHGLRMGKLVPRRKMKWSLMDVVLLIVPDIVGGIVGRDVLFGVRHACYCVLDTTMCGAPGFLSCLVLSKMGDAREGEVQTYLIFQRVRGRVE